MSARWAHRTGASGNRGLWSTTAERKGGGGLADWNRGQREVVRKDWSVALSRIQRFLFRVNFFCRSWSSVSIGSKENRSCMDHSGI